MGTFVVSAAFLGIFAWAFIHARKDFKRGKCAGCSGCSDTKSKKAKDDVCQIKL